MKKSIYILTILLTINTFAEGSLQAQAVFNDTILYAIRNYQFRAGFNDTMMLQVMIDFQTRASNESNRDFSGIGVLSMCGCYCDSIWDAWPREPNDFDFLETEGTAVMRSTIGSSGLDGVDLRLQRGRITVLSEKDGILEENDFYVNFKFKLDP